MKRERDAALWQEIAEIMRDYKVVKDVIDAADYIIIQWRATGIVNRGPLYKLAEALEAMRRVRVPGPPNAKLPPRPPPMG